MVAPRPRHGGAAGPAVGEPLGVLTEPDSMNASWIQAQSAQVILGAGHACSASRPWTPTCGRPGAPRHAGASVRRVRLLIEPLRAARSAAATRAGAVPPMTSHDASAPSSEAAPAAHRRARSAQRRPYLAGGAQCEPDHRVRHLVQADARLLGLGDERRRPRGARSGTARPAGPARRRRPSRSCTPRTPPPPSARHRPEAWRRARPSPAATSRRRRRRQTAARRSPGGRAGRPAAGP